MLKNLTKFFLIIFMNTVPLISSGMEARTTDLDPTGAGATAVVPSYVWTKHEYRFKDLDVVLGHNPAQQKLTINATGPIGAPQQQVDLELGDQSLKNVNVFEFLEPVKEMVNIRDLKEVSIFLKNVKGTLMLNFPWTNASIFVASENTRTSLVPIFGSTDMVPLSYSTGFGITIPPVSPMEICIRVPLSTTLEKMRFSEDRTQEILAMKEAGESDDAIFRAIGKTKEEIVDTLEIPGPREGLLSFGLWFD